MSMKAQSLRLTNQQYFVLDEIKYQYGNVHIGRLAYELNIPVPSVRRAIQELRREGYRITLEDSIVRLVRG